jgi:hypothetical protein
LVLRIPLAELVTVGEEAFLGAGLLLVAPASAENSSEAMCRDRVQQRDRLQAVAGRIRSGFLGDPSRVDRFLH